MTSRPECREVRQRKEATCLGHDAHAIRVCEGALQRVQRQRAAATPKAALARLAAAKHRPPVAALRPVEGSFGSAQASAS